MKKSIFKKWFNQSQDNLDSIYATPEEIDPNAKPLEGSICRPEPWQATLNTWLPGDSEYWPGHSQLVLRDEDGNYVREYTACGHTPGYNFVSNNCSNASGKAVEKILGGDIDSYLFQTPGDVRDFVAKRGYKPKFVGDWLEIQKRIPALAYPLYPNGHWQQVQNFPVPFGTAMDLQNEDLDKQIDKEKRRFNSIPSIMQQDEQWYEDMKRKHLDKINELESQRYIFRPFVNRAGGKIASSLIPWIQNAPIIQFYSKK